ncbi:ROK family protein [Jeotgalibacillus haloalkalitolerans]|uniref:ROK family protein n=1 Tax=Jeotgalibacillus haloalkalitolerans TaxID=3104292 RepID=A0ABU5KHQ5_9BACL|nr:ROK family protein [Jeotgalibacillus sp. HH7-29]MDZ5710684.1 ROK family protein [Jeotgalibacillus sp. HH7-29]
MRKYIAFDIGGTLIKYGVLAEDGTLLEKYETPTEAEQGGKMILEKVKAFGQELLQRHTIAGVCISTAGQVDSRQGKIMYASPLIPEYTGVAVKQELESHFNLPVEVENDVNCAGLAESWIGTGKEAKSLFCLTIGTGIGGSYILDNKLHAGHSFSGGEIGYIPIEGKQFEELASTRTLIDNVAKRKDIQADEIDGKKIFEMARNGDAVCAEEIDRLAYYLSKGIATIAYMMNPEMIIIGGGITAQKDYLYPLIMKHLESDLIPAILSKTEIKIAQNLNNAGMIGALRNFLLQESMQPLKSIVTMIESNHHKLTKREQLIAKYIMMNLESVPNKTISELSGQINVSEATITRFCQKLEFGSYNKLRLLAKEASVSTRIYEHAETSSISEVREAYMAMMNKFNSLHQTEDLQKMKQLMKNADQVFLYGGNEMSFVADQLKYKLLKLGIKADSFSTPYQMEMSTYACTPETVMLGFSANGFDREIIQILESGNQSGCLTIGVTSQQDSPMASVSDLQLMIPTTEEIDGVSSSIGEVSMYFLVDIILKELQDRKPKTKKVIV